MKKVTRKKDEGQEFDGLATKQDIRDLGALIEGTNHNVKLIAEQYGDIKKDIHSMKDTLDSHTTQIQGITQTLNSHTFEIHEIKKTLNSHTEMIGKLAVDVTTIKESLKEKVDRKEFVALDKRVLRIESKVTN